MDTFLGETWPETQLENPTEEIKMPTTDLLAIYNSSLFWPFSLKHNKAGQRGIWCIFQHFFKKHFESEPPGAKANANFGC